MEDLRNISGILPAQCRTNPNDCGIAWSEHRKVEPVKRDDTVKIEVPEIEFQRRLISNEASLLQVDPSPLNEYIKETMAARMSMSKFMIMSKIMIDVDQAEHGADQTAVTAFTLKPIDPQTIQVGDTVRLVGTNHLSSTWGKYFTKFKNYEVARVDRENKQGMPVMIRDDAGLLLWMFGEDLMLVESA